MHPGDGQAETQSFLTSHYASCSAMCMAAPSGRPPSSSTFPKAIYLKAQNPWSILSRSWPFLLLTPREWSVLGPQGLSFNRVCSCYGFHSLLVVGPENSNSDEPNCKAHVLL